MISESKIDENVALEDNEVIEILDFYFGYCAFPDR